jgi:hypothetical protein
MRLRGKQLDAINAALKSGTAADFNAALQKTCAQAEEVGCVPKHSCAINIIFDGPPEPVGGRFVEVETDDGQSLNMGEWRQRPDGLWALRITALPVARK